MGGFYSKGEVKIRPGNYLRYENNSFEETGAEVAVCAAIFRSNWGPQGKVMDVTPFTDIEELYGSEGTVDVLKEMLKGSATLIKAIRLGEDGEQGSCELNNKEGRPAVKIELKYNSSRAFFITCRMNPFDKTKKEVILREGTNLVNRVQFSAGENEVDKFITAVGDKNPFYQVEKLEYPEVPNDQSGILDIADDKLIQGKYGVSDDDADYNEAFHLLEAEVWDVLAIDSEKPETHKDVQTFINRIYKNGAMVQAVIGEGINRTFSERLENAKSFDDNLIVYVGGAADVGTELLDGYKAAARVAGMITGYDCSQSLTYKPITGATDVAEVLVNNDYIEAAKSGMLVFSKSRKGMVRIDNAINTLANPGITPEGTQDDGWKKIKRTRIRHELMSRISEKLDAKVGNVAADDDGKAEIIVVISDITDAMTRERKIANPVISLEPKASPDSVWFNIECDDIDSLEKIYVLYRYRYTASID